ncbi:hypothetical protein H4696_005282 [Amycolatopsis lexingtonensis]|uniref:Uncharacterized protein n=1 Tax=Amycolatopsis lexingtonensis TaxID=218822 RepID=A0ABR9I4T7_9PSEU|nr:hypothetical protein [Amycolatopsis lexingtonensis]MBE1498182.1 hypothetical protein [Amycolatopsis lexingtonensis]
MRRVAALPEEAGTPGLSREQRYRGARVVASFASDAGDCASLLDALGLEAADGVAGARPTPSGRSRPPTSRGTEASP